jgi:hypothetical protein
VLRNDLVMQTAVGRAQPLASAPTLSRLETRATPEHAAALHEVLMQQFIAGHAKAPKELVLDVDATHVPLHGEQERGHFHAYYDNYCYLPLYVFAGQDMLACVLRPSDRDPASVVSALIKRLLVPLRRAWPKTKIIVRADSGFCRPRVLQRPERWRVSYIIGLQKNSCLKQQIELAELALAEQYVAKQIKQRSLALQATELAHACTATIRTRLLKIGAAIVRNTRRVRVLLASAHPMTNVFITAARALAP